uniref:TOM1-like protein 6 n=1 Tax=Erigeron canadensis TaxID=72917 RepID=UPI001CB8ECF1|nr:TOM1-like protein 6 [Erigeron canadensis]
MMLPATAFSSPSSSSANSVAVRVDKATSEFLNGPDWTLNIDICDTINTNPWLAKDVVKALKKRLQHKNPNVQLLSLTLLETMVKNCGENVHFQIAERNILPEMIKIVKKKTDMRVREKILVLLDSWQEAFGGRGGKYPQYYFAYDELRQFGVQFPHRSPDAAPIITPPVTHPSVRSPQANYGMPSNSSTRLDEAMASEIENLSVSMIESMRNVSDLLSEMLQEVDPNDRAAVKDEVIVDVVDRCRSNQKKLMQMLASTSDEELLGQGIELNDNLQNVLAKHDAIASGSPIPLQITSSITPPSSAHKSPNRHVEEKEENSNTSVPASSPVPAPLNIKPEEEEEDEDDFALLARRHSKAQTPMSQNGSVVNESGTTPDPSMSMALTITDPPPPVNTTNADDMIDFLSLTLSSVNTSSPPSQPPPATSPENIDQSSPVSAATVNYPHQTQPSLTSYVVPWAQSEPQPQPQPQVQSPVQPQQTQVQSQYQQQNYSASYIPPPWAATPGYYTNNPYATSSVPYTNNPYAAPYNNVPSQQVNSYSDNLRAAGMSGDGRVPSVAGDAGQRPFVPSYRLFEDLNVLGNPKASSTSSNFPGNSSGQSIGGKK